MAQEAHSILLRENWFLSRQAFTLSLGAKYFLFQRALIEHIVLWLLMRGSCVGLGWSWWILSLQREKEVALSSVHQHNPDCDIWVHEYFTPSWFCLPNNQPALTVIRPGDTSRDVLEMICKVNLP